MHREVKPLTGSHFCHELGGTSPGLDGCGVLFWDAVDRAGIPEGVQLKEGKLLWGTPLEQENSTSVRTAWGAKVQGPLLKRGEWKCALKRTPYGGNG